MTGQRTEEWSCDQCGMHYADHTGGASLADVTTASAERWRRTVSRMAEPQLRERPDPGTWSVVEYGGHIADVLSWMVDALERMREEHEPTIEFFDPDRRAEEATYRDRDLAPLTDDVDRAADTLAVLLQGITDAEWDRTATFPWGERDVLDMARNAAHEAVHHLWDVERVAGQVAPRG